MVFSGLSLSLDAGQSLLARGPNGAGKSSLLRMLAGLIPCHYGRITRHGAMTLADENLALDGNSRLQDALSFWAHIDGSTPATLQKAMDHFQLSRLAELPVRMLSTGQRKRAILSRLAASPAPIWLLDEPGNGLDAASLDALGAAMAQHVANGGAIIAASHFDLPHCFDETVDLREAFPT